MKSALCAAFLLMMPSFAEAAGHVVTGADVSIRVEQFLQENGIAAKPIVAAERRCEWPRYPSSS